jgi:hypothetical protein
MSDTRDFKRTALLRQRIVGALRAAPGPMTVKELAGMSGIVELYHADMLPQKIYVHASNLVKTGEIVRTGKGQYAAPEAAPAAPAAETHTVHQQLRLTVSKTQHTITFVFEGLEIAIKVLP